MTAPPAGRAALSPETAVPSAAPGPTAAQVAQAHELALRRLEASARSRADLVAHLARQGVGREAIDQVVERLQAVGLIDDREFARQWVEGRRRSKGLSRARLRQELRDRGVEDDIIQSVLSPESPDRSGATPPWAGPVGDDPSGGGPAEGGRSWGGRAGDDPPWDDSPGDGPSEGSRIGAGRARAARVSDDDRPDDDRSVALDFARRRARAMTALDREVFSRRLAGQLARRGFSPAVVYAVVRQVADERESTI
jgi:SOS response regulatory protein OraA/RecX